MTTVISNVAGPAVGRVFLPHPVSQHRTIRTNKSTLVFPTPISLRKCTVSVCADFRLRFPLFCKAREIFVFAPEIRFSARGGACLAGPRIATWLILPVVIRLSQRLSHACLSINLYTVKLRMAHYISYSLFDSPLLLG